MRLLLQGNLGVRSSCRSCENQREQINMKVKTEIFFNRVEQNCTHGTKRACASQEARTRVFWSEILPDPQSHPNTCSRGPQAQPIAKNRDEEILRTQSVNRHSGRRALFDGHWRLPAGRAVRVLRQPLQQARVVEESLVHATAAKRKHRRILLTKGAKKQSGVQGGGQSVV